MISVSVILPTYNRAHVLDRAMQSVLEQTWTNFELLVIDDGSTDHTAQLLAKYSDPRLRRIYQENKGVSAARNVGIAASTGEFIALLDSDDYWLPQKIASQLDFMSQGPWQISQTNEVWIRNNVRVNPGSKHAKQAGWFLQDSLQLCLISPSCVMFTRKLWDDLGPFDEGLPACEDYSLWLRVGLRYPVGLLPKNLTVKTGGHSDQLSRSFIGIDLYRIYAMLDVLKTMQMTVEQKSLVILALQERVRIYARGCVMHGREDEARRVWELASPYISLAPSAPGKNKPCTL